MHRTLATALFALAIFPSLPAAPPLDEAKESAFHWIDAHETDLRAVNRVIWEAAEVGLEERRSSEELIRILETGGFKVERGVAGMPTAFIASHGSGRPVIAILAEYDALPGLSQKPEPERAPLVAGGNGHGCGHSLFGTASAGAALAAREAMMKHGIGGTLRLYGTPAEETGIGKVYMVKEGLFADCDAAFHWHPSDRNAVSFARTKAVISVKYAFAGLPAHASLSPQAGRSALDAVELMNAGANFLREHLEEEARIHYVITAGGGQPNVVPPAAESWYYLRADSHEYAEKIFARLEKMAQGAALMTETTASIHVDSDSHEVVPNRPLSELIRKNFELAGAPIFTASEKEFARKTQRDLERERGGAIEKPLAEEIEPLTAEPDLIKASTDVGDVSWMVPTGGLRTACYTRGAPGHSWQIVACSGMSIGEKGMKAAARTLAASMVEAFLDPSWIDKARADFVERRGKKPYTSLVPRDQKPPRKIR